MTINTRRWAGAADPVGIKWNADWRRPRQLGRYVAGADTALVSTVAGSFARVTRGR